MKRGIPAQPNLRSKPTDMIEPQTDLAIFRLFGWRCVQCNVRMATELNHIVPRSRDKTKINDWRNKVPMCHWCHTEYHNGGVSQEKVELLKRRRIEVLCAMHKENYV